ncbi:MAG TPA: helix-hairpin-helix domain-containing protein [Thermoanaerobaculia bacterium]|nr:helix-hairpin-helix domain-containing protein [Thermoanaerobaculia bacterium]
MKSRTRARAALALAAVLCVSGLASADTSDAATGKKININQASAKELANLPRIGAKVADRIVDYRQSHGSFARVEDLMEVKGIGEKLFVTLKPYLSLSGPTTLSQKVSSKGTRGGSAGSKSARNTVPLGKGR